MVFAVSCAVRKENDATNLPERAARAGCVWSRGGPEVRSLWVLYASGARARIWEVISSQLLLGVEILMILVVFHGFLSVLGRWI